MGIKMKAKSKDYIKGFKHGVVWAIFMAKLELKKWGLSYGNGSIGVGELASLEINMDNIKASSKQAVKSLREGR